ncbi:MAG: hypothetical protein H0T62_08495 [Parachlamydiaceae bacterium]|nr:hypothetical protein [Parachlamydiaceae bacterium]
MHKKISIIIFNEEYVMSLPEGVNNRQMVIQIQIPINEGQSLKKTTGGEIPDNFSQQQIKLLKKTTDDAPKSLVNGLKLFHSGCKCISNAWVNTKLSFKNAGKELLVTISNLASANSLLRAFSSAIQPVRPNSPDVLDLPKFNASQALDLTIKSRIKDGSSNGEVTGELIELKNAKKNAKTDEEKASVDKRFDEFYLLKDMEQKYKELATALENFPKKDGKLDLDSNENISKLTLLLSKYRTAETLTSDFKDVKIKTFPNFQKEISNFRESTIKVIRENKQVIEERAVEKDPSLKVNENKIIERRKAEEKNLAEEKIRKESKLKNESDLQETNSIGKSEEVEEVLDPDWATDDPWSIKEEKSNNIDQNTSAAPETNSAGTEVIDDEWENGTDNSWPTNTALEALQKQIDEKK